MSKIIVVGAGPAGLTVAYCLAKLGHKIVLVDSEETVGGCHRVRRVEGLFSEHGPRIYVNNYKALVLMLREFGMEWDDLFTPYNFNISKIGGQTLSHFTFREIAILGYYYAWFYLYKSWARKMTLGQLVDKHEFSKEAKDYLDRLCRLTDGGHINNYTVWEFFHLPNQNMLYTVCQPKLPNDVGLFKIWEQKLVETGNVEILLGHKVTGFLNQVDRIAGVIVEKEHKPLKIMGDKVVLAVPPESIMGMLKSSDGAIQNAFGPLKQVKQFTEQNTYFTYVPICYHWAKKLHLPKVWGFPKTSWGIAFVVLSDYMQFDEIESKTVISTCITKPDCRSPTTGKTANQSTGDELVEEVFRQLRESYPNLPKPHRSILSPGVYFANNRWQTKDDAFFYVGAGFLPQQSDVFSNLYNCGTHNGHADYAFTAMESAMENALELAYKIEPRSRKVFKQERIWTINEVVTLALIHIILALVIIYLARK